MPLKFNPERILEILGRAKGTVEWCVELNEQLFVGDPSALRGAQITIDDDACGRNSLEALILLKPAMLKIDRRLVTGACRDTAQEDALVRLARIAKAMDIKLVAKGIETRENLQMLMGLGIKIGQGFLWGRPE